MNLELNEIFMIIDKVKSTDLNTFEYQDMDIKIKIKNTNSGDVHVNPEVFRKAQTEKRSVADMPQILEARDEKPADFIKAPMVGTFYSAPAEGEEPFVSVGDHVKKGQVVGIIEAMKLMNEIKSDIDGIIDEALVQNGAIVEYGQPLFRVIED